MIRETVEMLQYRIVTLEKQNDIFVTLINDRIQEININMQYFDNEFNIIEDKFKKAEKQNDIFINQINELYERTHDVNSGAKHLNDRNDIIEGKLMKMEEQIKELRDEIQSTTSSVGYLRSRVTGSRCY